jgi:uncharacterized protein YndB with AHSA1/START domain
MATLSHEIRVAAPRDRVYEAIATREGLTGWYTATIDGGVVEGKEALFTFDGREAFRWGFVELATADGVRWKCTAGPGKATGSTVTFRLSDTSDGRTQVKLEHDGFEGPESTVRTCNTLWGILMGHLKAYAETAARVPAFH